MTYTVIDNRGVGLDWLTKRKGFIGASEAGAVVNLDPFKSQFELWRDKTSDTITDSDIDLFFFAKELEGPIARRAEQKWPDLFEGRIRQSPGLLRWNEHPIFGATPDALVDTDECDGVSFQIKTVSPYAKGKWGEFQSQADVPDNYRIQVILENAILDKPFGFIVPLLGLHDLKRPIRIDTDLDFLEWYVNQGEEWWERHIIGGEAPEIAAGDEGVADYWPGSEHSQVMGDEVVVRAARTAKRFRDIERKVAEYDDEQDTLAVKNFLLANEATDLVDPDGGEMLATWRAKKSPDRFKLAEFREAHPALYAEFSEPGKAQRSLLFKPTEQSRAEVAAYEAKHGKIPTVKR